MEAVVHLDRPAVMPSQSQMSYTRTTGLHGRPTQSQERDVRSYKNSPQQHLPPVSTHNPGPYSSVSASNYSPMRYIHPAPYVPPPGATPLPYRDNIYSSSRNSTNLVSERGQNVEFVRNEQIKPRISLLPSNDYLSLSRNRLHQSEGYRDQIPSAPPPQTVDAPLKKIRLGDPPKSDLQHNLRIDTRDDTQPAPTYNPQVEAISPTLPSEATQEDVNFRSTKDDLLHGIAKVDREITKTELQISNLKGKQEELEEAAKKPAIKKDEVEVSQLKHQSPAQKIYAENRKKAHDAHILLESLGPKIHLPLYNQPSDAPVYHENKQRHVNFRSRLLEHLRRKHSERENREKQLTTSYSQRVQDWLKKVEKVENSQKRKAKDAKNREYFEKIFPMLRKRREDRERFNRFGSRVKSEADIEEIMDGLQEQEMEDKKMRSYAVVPPLLLDAKQRGIYYINNNGRLDDFAANYKEKQLLNVWTQTEIDIFREKFVQHPKNFGIIATYLDKKSVSDCVQHYYLSKKTENYKRLLRTSRQRLRTRNMQNKVNSGSVTNNTSDILATASGVTTRLQREQLQKQEPVPSAASDCDSSFLLDTSQPPALLLPSEKQEKKKDDLEEKKKISKEDSTSEKPPGGPMEIGDSVTDCYNLCFTEIRRRIGVAMDVDNSVSDDNHPHPVLTPEHCTLYVQWTEEEIDSFKKAIKIHGLKWPEVAEIVGKSQHQCICFYNQEKLAMDLILSEEKNNIEERKPVLTDEEESGSSTSSCDEIGPTGITDAAGDSDTASAPSPLPNQGSGDPTSEDTEKVRDLALTPPPPQIVDESRERNPQSENNEHSQSTSSPQPKSSVTPLPPILYPAKEDYDSSATETADEGQGGIDPETPAVRVSSPKREEEPSSPLTVKDLMLGVIEMQLLKNQGGQGQSSTSVVGPPTISSILKSDHHSLSYTSQRDKIHRHHDINRDSLATVSVVNTHHSHQPMPEMPKDGLVVMQVQPPMREPPREPEGLDLSIKKPRESSNPPPSKIQHQLPSQNTVFRVAQPPDQQGFFHQQVLTPALAPKLSPGVISGTNPNSVSSKAQCGSIMHGTPVSSPNIYSQSRYEPPPTSSLIHQVSQHKDSGGSITQGTPVLQRSSLYTNPEYYQKRSTMPPAAAGYFSPRPTSYNVEQRQIIMNDYITSQQMHGSGNSSGPRSSRDKMYYQSNTRQGVIQRHNTKPPSPGVSHYPPGHEAFSSLVDVAVRQPSLPVPAPIPMSHEHKNLQDEKRHLHEGLGERFNRDSPHDRYTNRDSSERYIREPIPQKSHSQQQSSSREQAQQQQFSASVSHGGRDNYQTQHHLDREHQQMQRDHREREHHSQQSQKSRDSHMAHLELRVGRSQMPGYQSRILHETHHPLIQTPGFREQPSSSQTSNTASSRVHGTQEQSSDSQSSRGRCPPDNSTVTAATLIDAIITHQINQSSESQVASVPSGTTAAPQSQPTRPGDRLFQSFHRDCTESNGKISPVKSTDSSKGHSVPPQTIQPQIIDHVDVYSNPAASQSLRSSSMYQGFDHQTWKLRRALQKEEMTSQMSDKSDDHLTRFYQDAPVSLSPLDYVKNRIAEVMRTSEEESGTNKDNERPSSADMVQDEPELGTNHSTSLTTGHSTAPPFIPQPHTYHYPYSALSLNATGAAAVPISSHPVTKPAEPIPEPAPLLSAQYEPLSDED